MNGNRVVRRSVPWLLLAVFAAGVLATRLQLNFDISAFFPNTPDLQQKVLLQQFQSGPGSRLLVIGISGADRSTLEEISDELRFTLADDAAFAAVMNGEVAGDQEALPEPVASYYLLMQDIDYSAEALTRVIQERLQDLALGGGTTLLGLIARDPYLASLDVLERLAPVDSEGEMWFAADGSAVIMVETLATAVDIEGQQASVATVRDAFAAIDGSDGLTLEMTGAGAFAVELQQTIRAEAQKRSIMATVALLLVLFVFYRNPRYLLLAAVPLGMGFVVGLAVVALLFDTVHGITLAFGFTLMGVAIDYPLHLFSHAERSDGSTAIRSIWPTMRLGAISTAIAYIALAFSGSGGLAQLGVFTATGIATAVLVTRTWMPLLVGASGKTASAAGSDAGHGLRLLPAIGLAGIAMVAISQVASGGLWDDRLTSLSPVPADRIADDNRLRSAVGAPDMRHQLFLHSPTLETLLSRGEDIDLLLADAVRDGLLEDWQSLTHVLPSDGTIARRQNAVPGIDDLRARLIGAISGTPFKQGAFEPFLDSVARTKSLAPLGATAFDGTALQSWRDAHLVRMGDVWVSLISLREPDTDSLRARVDDWGNDVDLFDMYESSRVLMQNYRNGALTTVALAALVIVVLLWQQRRQASQVAWIALSVAGGLVMTVAVVVSVHDQLTVIHLVGLLLVFGLGLDYALFLGRTESASERAATRKAVLACAVSTTLAFGILAGSSIPVLKFLGLTVAAGSASSYLVALAGTRARV